MNSTEDMSEYASVLEQQPATTADSATTGDVGDDVSERINSREQKENELIEFANQQIAEPSKRRKITVAREVNNRQQRKAQVEDQVNKIIFGGMETESNMKEIEAKALGRLQPPKTIHYVNTDAQLPDELRQVTQRALQDETSTSQTSRPTTLQQPQQPQSRSITANAKRDMEEANKKIRIEYEMQSATLKIPSLWDRQIFKPNSTIEHYKWPNYSAGHHDQTLVKIDFIIDYLNNLLLISAEPTTMARSKAVVIYNQSIDHINGGASNETRYTDTDIRNYQTIARHLNKPSHATTKAYVFDPAVFVNNERPEDSNFTRRERHPLIDNDNFDEIKSMQLKQPRKRPHTALTESCDKEDDYDLYSQQQMDKIRCTVPTPAIIYTQMKTTQYELEHPHFMSTLHQRIFIGKLNDLTMAHSDEQMATYRLDDVAWKVFGLPGNNACLWSRKFITAMGIQMTGYILTLYFRIQRKVSPEFEYVYGKANAEKLHKLVYNRRLANINHQIQIMWKFLLAQCDAFQRNMSPTVADRPSLLAMAVTTPLLLDENIYEKQTPYQRMLGKLYDICQEKGYRKRDGAVYQQVVTPEGFLTNAFERLFDIKEFVWKIPNKNLDPLGFRDATSSARINENIVNFMTTSTVSDYFPEVKRQQYVWSFRNGIYDGKLDRFWRYDSEEIHSDAQSPYKRAESSARYIDKVFNDQFLMSQETIADPRKIVIKAMNRIFTPQRLSDTVQDWVWAFTGRMYFPVKEMDNWQVVFWLKGVAGTGKSTYAAAVRAPYDPADVGYLQNNIEPQFGLEPTLNKLLLIAPDVKSNFSLDPALFQTMASGDPMAISRKGLVAVTVQNFSIPQLYLSNVYPNWIDSSGSIQRRVMGLLMEYPVPESQKDTTLEKELLEHLDFFIVRACRSYHKKLKEVGTEDIWKRVPDDFKLAREEVSRATAELVRFFEQFLVFTGRVDDSTDDYDFVTFDDLEYIFHKQKQSQNITLEKGENFKVKLYRDIGSFHSLKVSMHPRMNIPIIKGCGLNLQQMHQVLANDQWLPKCSKYYTLQQIVSMLQQQKQQSNPAELNAQSTV